MSSINKPTTGYWVISIIALIWNAMGVSAYLQQAYQTDSFKAMNTPEQLEIINRLPSWYTAIFATAVFASLLGCIFLLLRKKFAVNLFKIGLLAVIIQTVYNLFMNEGRENYGTFEYSMLLMIPFASIFLVWFSKNVSTKGWLS